MNGNPKDFVCWLRVFLFVTVVLIVTAGIGLFHQQRRMLRKEIEQLLPYPEAGPAETLSNVSFRSDLIVALVFVVGGLVVAGLLISIERKRSEQITSSELRYRRLFESARDGILTVNAETGQIEEVNASLTKVLGCPPEMFSGKKFWELDFLRSIIPDDTDFTQWRMKLPVRIQHLSIQTPDGRQVRVEFEGTVVAANPKGVFQFSFRDITEEMRAVETMRFQNQYLHSVLETTRDGFVVTDTSGNMLDANEAYCRMMGYAKHEILEMRITDVEVLETAAGTQAHIRKIMEQGYDVFETKNRHNNGSLIDIEVSVSHLKGKRGRLVCFCRDITERKRVEEVLREGQRRYHQLETISRTFSWEIDLRGQYTFVSPSVSACLGYAPEDLVGKKHFFDLACPEDRDEIMDLAFRIIRNGATCSNLENRMVAKDGAVVWVQSNILPLLDGSSNIIGSRGADTDITERKRAEAARRALISRLDRVRDEERIRISRDLHDDLGQNLTAIKLDLVRIKRTLSEASDSPKLQSAKTCASRAVELADTTLTSVQKLAFQLRPLVLEKLGLEAALRAELRDFEANSGIKCKSSIPAVLPRIAPHTAAALYRILQESLTNIERHSGANLVNVQLNIQNGNIRLSISDNGSGIDKAALNAAESLGLLGMKERAAALGGETIFRRGAQCGTEVSTRLPHHEC